MTLPEADIALCLSVLMYWFDDKIAGRELLNRISKSIPRMFMDFGGQYATNLPFTEATVIKYMLDNTAYTHATFLGRSNFESRPMFLFER